MVIIENLDIGGFMGAHYEYTGKILDTLFVDFLQGFDMAMGEFYLALKHVRSYFVIEFSKEERVMEHLKYPNKAEHIGEHEKFIGTLNDEIRELEKGVRMISALYCRGLQKWVIEHYEKEDKALARFLEKGNQREIEKIAAQQA
jgi:hemerythrin-like metal-binding protein